MDDIRWMQVAFGFLGGGAVGAVLKIAYDRWRERKQPVTYRIERNPIFSSTGQKAALPTLVQVEHEGKPHHFQDLTLLRIDIANRGNTDLSSFKCGFELTGGH